MSAPDESGRFAQACEAAAAITQALVRDDALTVFAERVATALGVWGCGLCEYDAASGVVVDAAVWPLEPEAGDDAPVGARRSLDARPACRRTLLEGVRHEERADAPGLDARECELMALRGERASLSVPLVFDGEVVGCLTLVEKREGRVFDDVDRELAGLLAAPVAVALHNARLFRRQEEQDRHLTSLLESSRALVSAVTLEDSLARVSRAAAEVLAAGECVVYEYDPERDAIVFRAFYGAGDAALQCDPPGTVYPLDDHPSDRDTLRRGVVVAESLSDEGLPADVRESMERLGEKTCLNVPLLVDKEVMGLLVLIESAAERVFTAAEIELARAFGEQAAVAIRHGRLYRRGERQNRRLVALLETSRVLVSSLDAAAVLAEVRREVAGLFGLSGDATRILLRHADGFFVFEHDVDLDEETVPVVELDALCRRAVADLRPASPGSEGPGRLVVPLVVGDAAEGLIDIHAGDGRRFSDDELELLQILAGQAGAALANAGLYRTIERQAVTDGLTGLYNHRCFYERLTQEMARAQRYALPLSLLMIDIDDFKGFNDRYGHPAGDLALREVGGILTTRLRRGIDFAARYGGEEFVILLPNTSRDGAHVVGTRLLRELAEAATAGDAPPLNEDGAVDVGERIRIAVGASSLPAADADARITVSVGVACFPGSAGTPDELVHSADKALYLAKRLGKNRVEVFDA